MSDLKVRVESIYNLAISKLLLDAIDIQLVHPTNELQEHLQVDNSTDPHDVHIGDMEYRNGIQIKGNADGVEQIQKILRDKLPDSIVFNHEVQQDAIFLATVEKYIYKKRLAILDLGLNHTGILFDVETSVGDRFIVQIKELTKESDKLPVCSKTITLSGDYVILEVDASFVRVSRKIKGKERRRLHSLGKQIVPPGFGIIMRTSAASVEDETIQFEINKLIQQWEKIEDESRFSDSSRQLIRGELVSDIIIGNASKDFLDKVRSESVQTIPKYYSFKAYSMAGGFTADFAQHFTDRIELEELSQTMNKMIIERDYPVNNHLRGEFNLLDGTKEEVQFGTIIQNGDITITQRKLEKYHEEQAPIFNINEGDIVQTYFSNGSWTIHYKYFSGLTNDLLGEKLQIITPLDLVYRGRVRAFDLGMMLYKNADGETSSQVNDLTSNMVERGMISEELDAKLGEVLRVALNMLKSSEETILIHQNV